MERIRTAIVFKLRNHQKRFPADALMLFGMTENLKKRDHMYNIFDTVYRRHTLDPFMDLNEQILFSCWSEYDALLFEYLIQRSTINESGELYAEFGESVNQQKIPRPQRTEENTKKNKPFFVYVKMTKRAWTWGMVVKNKNGRAMEFIEKTDLDQLLPTASSSSCSLNSASLPSITSSSESVSIVAPIKKRERQSSNDDNITPLKKRAA
jgi:hypothetical protein